MSFDKSKYLPFSLNKSKRSQTFWILVLNTVNPHKYSRRCFNKKHQRNQHYLFKNILGLKRLRFSAFIKRHTLKYVVQIMTV